MSIGRRFLISELAAIYWLFQHGHIGNINIISVVLGHMGNIGINYISDLDMDDATTRKKV